MANCELVPCSSAVQLLDLLSVRSSRFSKSHRYDWVFRGQADSSWDLRPPAFRNAERLLCHVDRPWDEWDNMTQMTAEADTLTRFVHEADQSGLSLPGDLQEIFARLHEPHWAHGVATRDVVFEWPSRTVWPVVALAQHYGIATRFLDWTRSALSACYFAASDVLASSRTGELAIWAFSTAMANADSASEWRTDRKRVVIATAPYASNPNLRAQEGVHLALMIQNPNMSAPADRDDIGEFLSEIDDTTRPHGHPALLKFTLPATHAANLLWHLAKEGVSAARLFPGYAGSARAALESRSHAAGEPAGT